MASKAHLTSVDKSPCSTITRFVVASILSNSRIISSTVGRHSENLLRATLKSQVSEPSLNRYDRWGSFIGIGNSGCRLSVLITFQRLRNRGVCPGFVIRSIRVKLRLRDNCQTSRECQGGSPLLRRRTRCRGFRQCPPINRSILYSRLEFVLRLEKVARRPVEPTITQQ